MEKFIVTEHNLSSQNIIEASAGTGKTFSIALLFLRLIIEKRLQVDQILAVTFTKAAVAELQLRIRKFIQDAYLNIDTPNLLDDTLSTIVSKALASESANDLKDRLQLALYAMDEAQVNTIHSFCQKTLNEYAFETHQNFSATLVPEIDDYILLVAHDFWREVMYPLPVSILEKITFSIDKLIQIFKKQLSGQPFNSYNPHVSASNLYDEEAFHKVDQIDQDMEAKLENCKSILDTCFDACKRIIFENEGKPIHRNFIEFVNSKIGFLKQSLSLSDKKFFLLLPESYTTAIFEYLELYNKKEEIKDQFDVLVSTNLASLAIDKFIPKIEQLIQKNNVLTFDSLITNLHKNIAQEPKPQLIEAIQAKYKAVFIDEFQDTDKVQFEIFEQLFIKPKSGAIDNDAILYLIGDPKQSIYGFRGADVESYLNARTKIPSHQQYTMSENYRSTPTLIETQNHFFSSVDQAFGYDSTDQQQIDYINITAKGQDKILMCKGKAVATLDINIYKNKDSKSLYLVNKISELLDANNDYTILDQEDHSNLARAIKPSDICILIRNNNEGKLYKNALNKLNIPSVQLLDQSIYETDEAAQIIYILQAFLDPKVTQIRNVFYITFAKHAIEDFNALSTNQQNQIFEYFLNYHKLTKSGKVFLAFNKFLTDFNLKHILAKEYETLRVISNVEQIIQIINEQQDKKALQAAEILIWLERKVKEGSKDKTYTTQIESDEDAVKIITVHKSKGLEFNIVFISGLDGEISISKNRDFIDFKTIKGEKVFDFTSNLLKDETLSKVVLKQINQEDRRLLYVAMTRAKYYCNIFTSKATVNKSAFADFINKNLNLVNENLEIDAYKFISEVDNQLYKIQQEAMLPELVNELSVAATSYNAWWKISFSALNLSAIKHELVLTNDTQDGYEDFIFNKLKKGAQTGTKLHSIFENIDFQEDFSGFNDMSEDTKKQVRKFNIFHNKNNQESDPTQNNQNKEDYSDFVRQLIYNTVNKKISTTNQTFKLSDIHKSKRLIELEFNFNVAGKLAELRDLLRTYPYKVGITNVHSITGMLNGMIDLFFESNGEYFILDWKSNYLGNSFDHYDTQHLLQAMEDSNYHLQYLIYTVAIHKFLKARLKDYNYDTHFGGAIYLFLRGIHPKNNSGIFYYKPEKEFIEQLSDILN